MIPGAVVEAIFQRIQSDTSVVLLRFDEQQSSYPLGVYRSTSCLVESVYRNIQTRAEKVGDPTTVVQTRFEKYQDTYSLNFFDTQSLENARVAALTVFHWFGSPDNRSFCEENSIVPRFVGTNIQDKSIFQSSTWLYQVGFDIRFDYTFEYTEEIEIISKIQITEEFGSHNENLEVEV
ncbi:hypothetical protein CH352_14380 [Leptospira hartskeerlii]|uniref:Phage neck terminator protein gp12-like domain-containing protein n=1 Tax=Leptospira hartskeerlii TaxID=2023177 RepID=A0A2M9X9N4_9LEPT|nr:hypothetical protein [Leptospira hartskeerlii]PJZ24408.1 hypothetical protein CH357_15125 [Leptospira hartskeerlii]PJZ32980.1 hypothetical protein CH352_14380 [Leptospira hartskeerlii]